MTLDRPRDFVVADTSVMSYFASDAGQSGAYRALLAGRTIALSFFVRTELDGRDWDEFRQARLDALYRECVPFQPGEATSGLVQHGSPAAARDAEVAGLRYRPVDHRSRRGVWRPIHVARSRRL